ncbi:hypothetical protein C8Q80DRAFT_423184 [Daedaleopsis nitida]|nr:hypothetical protein C8Q80DRAFT_423184 [Daedaleopsis nitida]
MTRPASSTSRVFIWAACAQVLLTPSRASPGAACELMNHNSCVWPEHHVNITANVARADARPNILPAAGTGSQPDNLRCTGLFSPSAPSACLCIPLLMHLEAWEVLLPPDDLLYLLHDLHPAALSTMTQEMNNDMHFHDFAPSPSAPGRDERGREHDSDVCPLTPRPSCTSALTSAPATHPRLPRPAPVTPPSPHSRPRRSRMGRRSSTSPPAGADTEHMYPSAHSPAHAVPDRDGADFTLDSGTPRSVFGAMYDSYALWELASFVSAIAWLLVCLAA